MVRTKRPNVVHDDEVKAEEASEVDIRIKYNALFPIYNPIEGSLYQHFENMSITVPHCIIDWFLMDTLGVQHKLTQLLKIMGMDHYQNFKVHGSSKLCLESLSTLDIDCKGL